MRKRAHQRLIELCLPTTCPPGLVGNRDRSPETVRACQSLYSLYRAHWTPGEPLGASPARARVSASTCQNSPEPIKSLTRLPERTRAFQEVPEPAKEARQGLFKGPVKAYHLTHGSFSEPGFRESTRTCKGLPCQSSMVSCSAVPG